MVPRCKINIDFASWNHRKGQRKYESALKRPMIQISVDLPMIPRCKINVDLASWNHRQSQEKYESALKHRTLHIFVDFANGSTMKNQF